MEHFDYIAQKKRADAISKLTIKHFSPIYVNALNEFDKASDLRDVLFLSDAYLGLRPENYTAVLEDLILGRKQKYFGLFSTFTPFMCMVNLMRYGEFLSEGLRQAYERHILGAMPNYELDKWDFIGVNDNTPAMIMALMLLAGAYYNDKTWREIGLRRMVQLEKIQTDSSFISEFNSPTYQPITIYALAAVANYIHDDVIRERALRCEEHLWGNTFALYHKDTCQVAGPYSRAYLIDSVAHTHQNRMLLYQVMGEQLGINPINTIFHSDDGFEGICLHGEHLWFLWFSNVWLANMPYHCPPTLITSALNREYPASVCGNARISASADTHLLPDGGDESMLDEDISPLLDQEDIHEYAAGESRIFSYLNRQYALGTCTKEFHNGIQTDSFHLLTSMASPARKQEDISGIYARYIINNNIGTSSLIPDQGRKLAFQHKSTAMVLYSPKTLVQEISAMKLSILIDNRFNNISEVVFCGKSLSVGANLEANAPIFVRLNDVYCAFIPLTAGERASWRIEKIGTALALSIVSYEGAKRHFCRKALKLAVSGFVVEVRGKYEVGSFENFVAMLADYTVEDRLYANLHTRYACERKVHYNCGGLTLGCCYSPVSEGIRYLRMDAK